MAAISISAVDILSVVQVRPADAFRKRLLMRGHHDEMDVVRHEAVAYSSSHIWLTPDEGT